MIISDFICINDSTRTLYNVYRGDVLVDIIVKDYQTQDPKLISYATRLLNRLMDTNGYVERITPWYEESAQQIWLYVDVQIGAQDYPDRL